MAKHPHLSRRLISLALTPCGYRKRRTRRGCRRNCSNTIPNRPVYPNGDGCVLISSRGPPEPAPNLCVFYIYIRCTVRTCMCIYVCIYRAAGRRREDGAAISDTRMPSPTWGSSRGTLDFGGTCLPCLRYVSYFLDVSVPSE